MGYQSPLAFTDDAGDAWRGLARPDVRDLLTPELGRLLRSDEWVDALPADFAPVGQLSANAVRVQAGDFDLVLKRVPADHIRWWASPVAVFQGSRARRAFEWSHRLRAFGITTPRPLAYLERRRGPRFAPSLFVAEYVEAPTLERLRDAGLEDTDKRQLIDRVAGLLATMHARRLLHADFHVGNVLVAPEALYVLDLESMRPYGRRSGVVLKNLVRLNRDFLDLGLVTSADRMRFLDRYLKHQADRSRRRRSLFDVVRVKTEAKLLERGEQFVPRVKVGSGI
ncbi:MAG: lipopolysaccharide kinase InaA family protein [Deltaproteobacteria bacterium]